jgi:diguanylate cyclase (GGDEF)-like protein
MARPLEVRLVVAACLVGLLLGVLTWTTLQSNRAARALAASVTAGVDVRQSALTASARATRQADIALRVTWIAAIVLVALGYRSFSRGAPRGDGDTLSRQRHEEELRTLSLTDELTGLHNRRGFLALAQQQIKLARRNKRELVLLFVDMDDFNQINDRYGHQQGDVALQRAARVLRSTFRDSDIIARYGGDEFVVLAADTGTSSQILARLRRELQQRNERDGYPYTLSFSVGAARFDPEEPPSIDELLQTADAMLYEQKRQRPHTPAIAD